MFPPGVLGKMAHFVVVAIKYVSSEARIDAERFVSYLQSLPVDRRCSPVVLNEKTSCAKVFQVEVEHA